MLALVGLYWDWLRASPVRRLFPALQVEYNGQRMMFDDSCANGSGSFSSRERAGVRGPRVWDKAPHPNPLPKGEGKEWAHSKGQGRDDLWKYSAHTTTPLAKRLSVLRGRRKCQGSDVRCRVTHVAGQATYQAALAVHQQICEVAAHVLGCPTTAVALDNSACVVHSAPTRRLTFAEVAAAAGQHPLRAQTLYRVSQSPHMSPFTAQVVEVEVDPDTGQVMLLEVVTAHDVGTIINPLGHQGQIGGGLMQDSGYGLLEEMPINEGRIGTLSLGEYKLPNIKDIPPLRTVLVQEEVGPAPFQGKAIGESSITPIAAAIANAVDDAVGVRLDDLPITAEKVYQELQSREGRTP